VFGDMAGAVVLVVHAHPDDEVFATGAATIAAHDAGATVHLRLFTGGEGRSSGLTEAELVASRQRKEMLLSKSIHQLGINDWAYLSEAGRWTDTPHAPDLTIAQAPVDALGASVANAIATLRPDVLLTVGSDGLTGHPDHVACHRAVQRALDVSGHVPPVALGAVLDRHAVRKAHERATSVLRREVGSGRVTGVDLGPAVVTVTGPPRTEERRRRALDAYVPGLGTAEPETLSCHRVGAGDSVLLRFVLDSSGWNRDQFVKLRSDERRGIPEVTQ
jgi:LmbE family N-acetylglucosaminyl deacetylase